MVLNKNDVKRLIIILYMIKMALWMTILYIC